MKTSNSIITEPSKDYELLDSGEGEKLERFGRFVLARPDPQSLWHKRLPESEWKKADGRFGRNEDKVLENEERGSWSLKKDMPDRWEIELSGLKFFIKPTTFKHVGIFPEQSPNWMWLRTLIANEASQKDEGVLRARRREHEEFSSRKISVPLNPSVMRSEDINVLNLFGYTGGASLACAHAGAKVVHVDGSKVALTWARENAELSGLEDKPIRWILDDAREFVRREIKRGHKYHGIIMDPPAFGHGPENELWKIEEHFLPLIDACISILADKPLFFLINGYSAGYSAIAYENNLLPLVDKFGGKIEKGELAIEETGKEKGRLLPAGIFARWSK